MLHVKIISFTESGALLGALLRRALPDILTEHYARGCDASLQGTQLSRFAQQAMFDCDGLVFIGAAGIAVRAIAPYLRGKTEDPAVLVLDEAGQFVVPLLSGHLGGANALAARLAAALGAAAVLTTATDVRQVFAVDSWAASQGLCVHNPAEIRALSAALLRGERIGFAADFAVRGALPAGVSREAAACGFTVSCRTREAPFLHTLHLVPRAVVAGIGCRRGKSEAALRAALEAVLAQEAVPLCALCAVATIACKQDEPGLLALCRALGVPLLAFSAEELGAVEGDFTESDFVAKTVGVGSVCERAAVRAGGQLLRRKTAQNGVTIALAVQPVEVTF